MKTASTIRLGFTLLFLPLLSFFIPLWAISPDKYVSIEKYMDNTFIKGKITGVGGHTGNCVVFDLTNMRSDTLFVKIEPGRRLVSKDSTEQDILIVKESRLILPPMAHIRTKGYGFCCEATMHSPRTNAIFSVGRMAPLSWVRIADSINSNFEKYHFSSSMLQSVVWIFSNNHQVSSISNDQSEGAKYLIQLAAILKGVELPWYSLTYQSDPIRLFSNLANTVRGNIPYYLHAHGMVTIIIRNKQGDLMAVPVRSSAQGPGQHTYPLDLDVKNWPRGEYEISIYEDEANLNFTKKFKL